mgnify:CR=1 FL=1
MKSKYIYSLLVLFMLSFLLSGGSNVAVKEEDFNLTVEINKNDFVYGEEIIVEAKFVNLSNERIKINYSGSTDISSIINFYIYKEGEQPDLTGISNSVEGILKKNDVITNKRVFLNYDKGKYHAFALVHFIHNDVGLTLKSDVLNFVIS